MGMRALEKQTDRDYYEILQVNRNADQEMIERAYRLLAKRYHPDNSPTGDAEKFNLVVTAYRILSDPKERALYDRNGLRAGHDILQGIFSVDPSSSEPDQEAIVNEAILLVLYYARRKDVTKPAVGIVDLEQLLHLPEKQLAFHTWYLKEKGWIRLEDSGGFSISADGVDKVRQDGLVYRKDKLLPFFNESPPPKNDPSH